MIRQSLAYSLANNYVSLILQLAGTMVISRLLSPAETGIFAVATVFAALASTIRDFGIAEYLIQEQDMGTATIRAALTVNIITSWAMGALLFVAAPFAADFYGSRGVADVMRVQAINFLLIPFGAVTMAYFRRQLDFRPIFYAGLLANCTALTVSVACALRGMSYMSLAWSSLASVVVTVAVSWWFRPKGFPWLPGLSGIGRVVQFGKYATGIYVFGQLGKGAPEMIIGRVNGIDAVAYFSRANGLVEAFQRLVLSSIVPVCQPYFASNNRRDSTLLTGYLRSVSYLTAVGWPFLLVLGTIAYAAIRIVYGPQWIKSVPLAQILCGAAFIELAYHLSKEALLAQGSVRESNRLQMITQGCLAAGLLVGIPFGLEWGCWGLVAASAASALIAHAELSAAIGLSTALLIKHCLGSLKLAVVSALPAIIWTSIEPISEQNFVRFAVVTPVLSLVSWILSLRMLRHPLWEEMALTWHLVKERH